MQLIFLMLADAATSVDGKLYALGAGYNQLHLSELPQQQQLTIALGLDVSYTETGQEHQLSLHIEDPNGEVVGDQLMIDLHMDKPPIEEAGIEQRVLMSLGGVLTFTRGGAHEIVVKRGEEELGRSRFYVRLQAPESAPARLL